MTGSSCLAVCCCLLIAGTAVAEPLTIRNPAAPPTVETWHLRELWRLDNDEDPDLPLLGVVNVAAADADGTVYLLDHQLAHVLKVSAGGKVLGTVGRSGQGPGEVERPYTLFTTDRGQLGVVQAFPGKIVLLNPDGTPDGGLAAGGENPSFTWAAQRGGNLVAVAQTLVFGAADARITHKVLARLDADGGCDTVYFERTAETRYDPPEMHERDTWFPDQAWALAGDGSVLVATDRDAYRLTWFEPDGGVRRVITRDFAPHVRTDAERREVLDSLRLWGRDGELEPRKTILDTEPALHRIQVARDGRIWVQSCDRQRDLPAGVHCRYDVFDAAGHLEKEVRIAYPVDRDRDMFTMLDDGRFVLFRNVRSALDAMYAGVESRADENEAKLAEVDEADLVLQVILLERDAGP